MFIKKISFIGDLNQEKKGNMLFIELDKDSNVNKYNNNTITRNFKMFLLNIWNTAKMITKKFNVPI